MRDNVTSDRLVTAGRVSPETRLAYLDSPFVTESGAAVEVPTIAYRTWGTLAEDGSNAVLVCHALTGSADADSWWPGLIGPGAPLDPARDFIVCSNVIGGCYGSSGPYTPAADGGRLGLDFPEVTVRDMVRAQKRLLDRLGVRHLQLVIGPSLGGMQTLEWAASFPDFVSAIAPIGVSGRHSAWCIGVGESQRAAIAADSNWQGGRYEDSARPEQGLSAARMMAMIMYRSWQNFEERFERKPDQAQGFDVSSYLQYQGRKLVERFDAASYYRLTQAMDSHDLGRGRGGEYLEVLAGVRNPALVVAVTSDVLYPPREQQTLASHLPAAIYRELDSAHGHDGFLIDLEPLAEMIAAFRSGDEAAVAACQTG
ncbi:MAG: homoserine O-acetyltransferase [Pseudomonadota bacterium]